MIRMHNIYPCLYQSPEDIEIFFHSILMLFDHIEFIWRLLQKFKMIDADSSDEENDVEEIGIPPNADAILQSNVEDPGHRKLSLLSLFNSYTILLDNQNYSWGQQWMLWKLRAGI